jgi:membrane-associated phospholipid phosphatase
MPLRAIRWVAGHANRLYTAYGAFVVISLVLSALSVWIVAELAGKVVEGGAHQIDDAMLRWINQHASAWLDKLALQITAVGNGGTVIVLTLVTSAFLWVARQRLAIILLVSGVLGADLVNRALKVTFDRPRPELFVIETPFARPISASFPSGHATGAIAFYLVVAYLLGRLGGKGWFKVLVNLLAAVLVLAIGASRMYLGVHYPSDVLAGWLIGFIWVTLCILGFQSFSRTPLSGP